MDFVMFWSFIIACAVLPLSIPPAIMEKSWKRFFIAILQVTFGLSLPLATFFLSVFLAPEWKGDCRFKWLDCFHLSKLYLTPLVLWACVSFYRTVVLVSKLGPSTSWMISSGLFLGFSVSMISSVIGLLINNCYTDMEWGMVIPLYTSVLYGILWWKNRKTAKHWKYSSFYSALGTVPFWIGVVYASKKQYLALPDEPPDCFIVTAAMNGHEGVVGPFSTTKHRGGVRRANHQLITFWKLEELWQQKAPRFHRAFRGLYNCIGPHIARRMDNPFMADTLYLLLKPAEYLAIAIIHHAVKKGRISHEAAQLIWRKMT